MSRKNDTEKGHNITNNMFSKFQISQNAVYDEYVGVM